MRRGEGRPAALAEELGLASDGVVVLLDSLYRRRLLLRSEGSYVSLRRAAAAARDEG